MMEWAQVVHIYRRNRTKQAQYNTIPLHTLSKDMRVYVYHVFFLYRALSLCVCVWNLSKSPSQLQLKKSFFF